LSIAQLIVLVVAVLFLLTLSGVVLWRFRGVSLKWWLIRSVVAIAPVGVGFGLVYSLHAWNRDGLLLLSFVALVATLLNWRLAKGIADQYAKEYVD
jgi:hypothetical protein